MAVVANLTPFQQEELEKVFTGFKSTNPDLLWKFFNQDTEIKQPLQQIKSELKDGSPKELEDKIDALTRKLDLIFGNHILVDGKLVCVGNF